MQQSMLAAAWAAILSLLLSGPVSAATLQVGPQRALKLPSEVAKPERASGSFDLWPKYQYVHLLGIEPRRQQGPIDVGAYEFGGR